MRFGVTLRNMGVESTPDLLLACARRAESLGCDSLWITDHIAIPPDDAEGSGGRYLDTLTTLAWLGGATERIKLGSGVLILPYRPLLPTAKQVATLQELTASRLLLGVGVGWMDAEFRALGVSRGQRGAITDRTLAFLDECFANDEVSLNGQPFLFKPRPPKPPVLVGGGPPHALQRAAELAEGWLPMARSPQQIADHIGTYRHLAEAAGRGPGLVVVMTRLPEDAEAAQQMASAYAHLGVDELVCSVKYSDIASFGAGLERVLTDVEHTR